MSVNHQITPSLLKEEIEKLKVVLQEQKQLTYTANDSLNRKLNDYIERNNVKISQLNNFVELLLKENSELKQLLAHQKFVVQPVNQYQVNSSNQIVQVPNQTNANAANQITLPFEALLSSSGSQLPSSSNSDQRQQTSQPSQQQVVSHAQAQQAQQSQQQVQLQQQVQSQQQVQGQHHHHHHSQNAQAQAQQNGNIDSSLTESSANNGILRFINNQYVDDEQSLNTQHGSNPNAQSSRIDFVFMDPSASRSRHYRTNSNNGYNNEGTHVDGDDDEDDEEDDDDEASQIDQLSPPQSNNNSSSRLQKSSTRQGEFDAENYDLIIHNDFNKVEDIYYEYQNSLKPQVEKVQKAYKIKKIRKYQKIKALAVRIERYKELKNCSLPEAFQFFDNLRIAEDNTKRSIAWLYNTLPDVLKKHNLEDQLKRNNNGP